MGWGGFGSYYVFFCGLWMVSMNGLMFLMMKCGLVKRVVCRFIV